MELFPMDGFIFTLYTNNTKEHVWIKKSFSALVRIWFWGFFLIVSERKKSFSALFRNFDILNFPYVFFFGFPGSFMADFTPILHLVIIAQFLTYCHTRRRKPAKDEASKTTSFRPFLTPEKCAESQKYTGKISTDFFSGFLVQLLGAI